MNFSDADRALHELQQAAQDGDPRAIVRAMLTNAWPLYETHYEVLAATVAALPPAVIERNPILAVVNPMAAILARTGRASRPVLQADEARAMTPDEMDLVALVQMIASRMSGDVAAAVGHAARLEERIVHIPAESRGRIDGPLWFFHHQIGSTYLAAGRTGLALREFATSRQLARLSPLPYAERLPLARAALAHAARGSLEEAERALAEARALPAPTAAHRRAAEATENAAAALLAVERGQLEGAEITALESYDSYEISWSFALLARARALLALHRPDDAWEAARLASEAHPRLTGAFGSDVVASVEICALVALGEIERARTRWSAGAPGPLTRLAGARLALCDGEFSTAARLVDEVVRAESSGPAHRAEALVLSGWAELARTGHLDAATAQRILRLALNRNHRRLFSTVPRQVIERLRAHLPASEVVRWEEDLAQLTHPEMEERPQLTRGELRVLDAMTRHATTADIAAALHVSPNTIKSQLRSIYRKLRCSTREDALSAAARLRVLRQRKVERAR